MGQKKAKLSHMRKLVALLLCITIFWGNSLCQSNTYEEEYLPISEDIVAEEVPKIPYSILDRHDYYTATTGDGFLGWNKGQEGILLLGATDDGPSVILRRKPGQKTEPVAMLQSNYYDVYPSHNGKSFAYTYSSKGNEQYQIYVVTTGSEKATPISDQNSRNVEPVWSRSDKFIAYGHTQSGSEGMKLIIASVSNPQEKKMIASSKASLEAIDWSSDDRYVVYIEYLSNISDQNVFLHDIHTGKTRLLSKKKRNEVVRNSDPRFSRDGKGIYLLTNQGREMTYLAYLDLKTLNLTPLAEFEWEVEEYALSPDGKKIVVVVNEDGASKLYNLDLYTKKITSLGWDKEGVITQPSFNESGSELGFNFSWYQSRYEVYSVNISTRAQTHWSKGVSIGFPRENFTKPHLIRWSSFDKRLVSGYIYRPPAKFPGQRPVLIVLHGGPEDQYRPVQSEEEYFIQENGMAVLYPNFRGSVGYGKAFEALDNRTKRLDAAQDIGALLDWIKQQSDLDSDRVFIKGASYGGYLALTTAMLYSERLRGVISQSAPTNLISAVERTAGWRRIIRRAEYGDERDPKERALIESISPLSNAVKIKVPLLISHGALDPRVPVADASKLVSEVRKGGNTVWFVLSKKDGHEFYKGRSAQLGAEILFIRHLI